MAEQTVRSLREQLESGVKLWQLCIGTCAIIAFVLKSLIGLHDDLRDVKRDVTKVVGVDSRVSALETWRVNHEAMAAEKNARLLEATETNRKQDEIIARLINEMAINTTILQRVDSNVQRLTHGGGK